MQKIEQQLASIIKDNGLSFMIQSIISHFDNEADFASLSGSKKEENECRKIAVILFETLRKIDGVK